MRTENDRTLDEERLCNICKQTCAHCILTHKSVVLNWKLEMEYLQYSVLSRVHVHEYVHIPTGNTQIRTSTSTSTTKQSYHIISICVATWAVALHAAQASRCRCCTRAAWCTRVSRPTCCVCACRRSSSASRSNSVRPLPSPPLPPPHQSDPMTIHETRPLL